MKKNTKYTQINTTRRLNLGYAQWDAPSVTKPNPAILFNQTLSDNWVYNDNAKRYKPVHCVQVSRQRPQQQPTVAGSHLEPSAALPRHLSFVSTPHRALLCSSPTPTATVAPPRRPTSVAGTPIPTRDPCQCHLNMYYMLAWVLLWPVFICQQSISNSYRRIFTKFGKSCGRLWTREELLKFFKVSYLNISLSQVQPHCNCVATGLYWHNIQ